MEFYVEYKPCYKTIRDKNGRLDYGNDYYLPPIVYFKDGKSNCGMIITQDYKFIYGFINLQPTIFRITNISSKPIKQKYNSILQYKKIQNKIDDMKKEQSEIIRKMKNKIIRKENK